MKFYITKYALSQGIKTAEAQECGDDMIEERGAAGGYTQYFHGEGKEWHRSREAAVKRAEEMRKKKIESLFKQISKLEKMSFRPSAMSELKGMMRQ